MDIYFTNSLTKKKEKFKPNQKNKVGLYTCGPTVYNNPHIGNLLPYIFWDVLKRFLESQNYEVNHVMNLTDVGHLVSDGDTGEDKMEKASRLENKSAWEIAHHFIKVFKDDIRKVNVLPPTKYLRATDTIEEQINFVKILDEKGYLYRTHDGMYFDTSKLKKYGQLANLDKVDLQEGARVEKNEEKKNITDFAVWKFSPQDKQRQMEWDSPWGKGFPGWHLECSVMSRMELGDNFDIHTGGIDHLTVHHPNEMAQSEAVTGKLQANYWLHNAHIKFDGGKISKSAGTFITIGDIIKKGYWPMAYRYLILQNHYRKPVNFSWHSLEAAENGLKNIIKSIAFLNEGGDNTHEKCLYNFYEALADDLNTSKALAVLQTVIDTAIDDGQKLATIYKMDEVLGLNLQNLRTAALQLTDEAKELLNKRQTARENKDWELSDKLRTDLEKKGVEVQDTAQGQKAISLNF